MVLCYFCGSKGVHECCIKGRTFICEDCETTTPATTKQLTNDSDKKNIQQNQLEIKSNRFSDNPGNFNVLSPVIYLRRCDEESNSAIELVKNLDINSNNKTDIRGNFNVLSPVIFLSRCDEEINPEIKLVKNIKRKRKMTHIESETHDIKRSRS